jgi:hypothetical protein
VIKAFKRIDGAFNCFLVILTISSNVLNVINFHITKAYFLMIDQTIILFPLNKTIQISENTYRQWRWLTILEVNDENIYLHPYFLKIS